MYFKNIKVLRELFLLNTKFFLISNCLIIQVSCLTLSDIMKHLDMTVVEFLIFFFINITEVNLNKGKFD